MKKKEKWLDFHKKGIRTQMMVYIGILVVLPLCLGLMVLNIYLQKVMSDNKVRFDSSSLLQIKNNADQIIEVMNYSTSMMIVNQDVLENIRLLGAYPDSYELYRAKTSLSTRLADLESSVLNAVDGKLAILTTDGYLIGSYNISKTNLDYEKEAWYGEILENGRKITFQPELIQFFQAMSNYTIRDHQHLYIGRSIQDYSGRPLGIIMVQLSASKIWGKYTQALEKSGQEAFYILDDDFRRLIDYNGKDDRFLERMSEEAAGWSLNQKHVLRGTMDAADYYMAILLEQSENVLLYSIPASVYREELSGIASGIFVLIFLLVFLTILTMIYFSGKLSRPLIYMVDMLEQSDNGILKLRDTKPSFGEMNKLIASYNKAGERIEDLIKKVKLESELKEKAHYEMLMSQISPHFIFNTVHSIQIMAQKEQDTRTERALESLGAILQAVYRSKNGMTTVGQETILLQAYVEIMQLRFGDSFHFYNTIPAELYLYEIPAFTMQPIVENAILHGVRDMKAGQIIVSAVEYPHDFMISVFDNGESADKEKMDRLLKKPNKSKSAFTGIGLYNVNSRLKMLYGDSYGLIFNEKALTGFEIWIRIPKGKSNA
ncbi:hypothetical protein EBB54_21220 [Schaedlerella arabinosiphila]|jgi:two-component system sensor histidine kinase YesM|uniref:Uncharacterized protein n=1 Tax=Schaedlerella arabinosiphila TaxID=2044587 RepID=A0A426DLF7_9FIRM|nr:histidine kinase [Schaedlerella arabinosiphila]RRK33592.1 hypothetical protein EBB54_21220 [Schaedlerella arabinosiphila]